MHARIRELLDHLDGRRSDLVRAVAAVPTGLRERRPGPDRWSVAEVLEHLALVERRVGGLVATQLATARQAGLGVDTESSPVVPTLDVEALLDRSRRLAAGAAVHPTEGLDASAAWTRLDQARAALVDTLTAADGLALGEVSVPHARLGELTLYQWVAFVGAHEGRHAAQIREIGAELAMEA
jgi:uncharacterized damage-inducible protein DinB